MMPRVERIPLCSVNENGEDGMSLQQKIMLNIKMNELQDRLGRLSMIQTRLCMVGAFLSILTVVLLIAVVFCLCKVTTVENHSLEAMGLLNKVSMNQKNSEQDYELFKNKSLSQNVSIEELQINFSLLKENMINLINETKVKNMEALEKSLLIINKSIADDKTEEEKIKKQWKIIKNDCDSKANLLSTIEDKINKLETDSAKFEDNQDSVRLTQESLLKKVTVLKNITDQIDSMTFSVTQLQNGYSNIGIQISEVDLKTSKLESRQFLLEEQYDMLTNVKQKNHSGDIAKMYDQIQNLYNICEALNQTQLNQWYDIETNEENIDSYATDLNIQGGIIVNNKKAIAIFRSRIEVVERNINKKIAEVEGKFNKQLNADHITLNTTMDRYKNKFGNITNELTDFNSRWNVIDYNVSRILEQLNERLINFDAVEVNTANIQDIIDRIDILDHKINLTNEVSLFGFLEPPQCQDYANISDSWRMIKYGKHEEKHCDKEANFSKTWSRFVHPAGIMLPTHVPLKGGSNRKSLDVCGTAGSSWMRGSHPSGGEGIVNRTVCFEWSVECEWFLEIQVVKCHTFYLYNLKKPTVCNLAYCTV